jgi:hypothetical protein
MRRYDLYIKNIVLFCKEFTLIEGRWYLICALFRHYAWSDKADDLQFEDVSRKVFETLRAS